MIDYMRGLLCTLNTVQKHTTPPRKAKISMQSYIKQEKYPAQGTLDRPQHRYSVEHSYARSQHKPVNSTSCETKTHLSKRP